MQIQVLLIGIGNINKINMKNSFNYIAYRVFEYFNRKDEALAVSRTIDFLALFQGALIIPLFIIVNLFTKINPQVFGVDNRIKYYIGIPLAVFLILLNSFLYKKKLKGDSLQQLKEKYHKDRYKLNIWFIFLAPVIFVLILPILYGVFNGTLRVVHP